MHVLQVVYIPERRGINHTQAHRTRSPTQPILTTWLCQVSTGIIIILLSLFHYYYFQDYLLVARSQ